MGPWVERKVDFFVKNMRDTYSKLIDLLDKHHAVYRLIDHAPEGRTEIVSPMRGNTLSQAAKCMVLSVNISKTETKYVLGVVPGDRQIDFNAVKTLMHASYVSFAPKEIAEELAQSVAGTVLPFPFTPKLELIVDPTLLENDELFFNAARLDRSMALKTKDYVSIAKPRLAQIAKSLDAKGKITTIDTKIATLRHSCAHLLAAAVLDLYPEAKPTIGPSIETGFYYDFDDLKISEQDLEKIEQKMHQLVKEWAKFELAEGKPANIYKQELVDELVKKGEKITYYKSGDFIDLCAGPHIEGNPKEILKHFKLLKVAGAYWHGDEKNKMLTRIYGTAFPTKEELDKYLWQLAEAEKRDHRKIGRELELFMFHEAAPGMPYWLPKGVSIVNELIKFWREEHYARGYKEIISPLINKKELYLTSGHWEHYKEDMFISETEEGETYGLKPMNCPNAMVVFGSTTRSYRELPLRLGDTDTLHRNERSGTLNGLLRVREFKQDDAHIFVTEDQIKSEYKNVFDITERFYSVFGLEYRFRLGTRPEKFMGDVETWDRAEKELKEILEDSGKEFFVLEGDGAFYGPKVDIIMKDALGRDWQMGTIQLDFQIPKNFQLTYAAEDGTAKTPVVIHRVIYGSLERFIGIIIEHFSGAFPTWLSPVQVAILPIADRHLDYAKKVETELKEAGIRVELDERSEKLGAKIRDAQMQKNPYMIIIGDKELEAKKISVRKRDGSDLGSLPLDEFIKNIRIEIVAKTV